VSIYDGQVQVDIYETKEQWDATDPFTNYMPWSRLSAFVGIMDLLYYEGLYSINIFTYVEEEAVVEEAPKTSILSKAK
jgi:hypothetical protein